MKLTTSDLYESGFLHCSGAFLANALADRGNSSTVVFVFEDETEKELLKLREEYHLGKATVNLAEYRHSLEILKDIMFRVLKNNHKNRRAKNAQRTSIPRR